MSVTLSSPVSLKETYFLLVKEYLEILNLPFEPSNQNNRLLTLRVEKILNKNCGYCQIVIN